MKEIWKDIVGFEGKYKVSNTGKVKTLSYKRTGKEQILSIRLCGEGYHRVALYNDGKVKNYYVHVLVARHFLSNPNNYPEVNHIDGNKLNNRVDNLEWVSSKQNSSHAVISKLRILPVYKVIQATLNGIQIKEWDSVSDIHTECGYDSSVIYKCCENKINHAYGYKWSYSTRDTESNVYIGGEYY